jgi:two-component sensor histidine kinase
VVKDPSVTATGLPETDQVAQALFLETRHRIEDQCLVLQSERRLRLVIRELNHRAKNALTTVQALAYQTARSGFGDETRRFVGVFSDRLESLARAHDLLTAHAWDAIGIEKVVSAGLAPWLGGGAQRQIVLTEAELPAIAPRQAQALMLAFHELATNATKYGALSVPEGVVEVRAHVEESRARVEWIERGGPPIPGPPTRKGFGTNLMEKLVRRDLGDDATVDLRFEREGLAASFHFTRFIPTDSGESHAERIALSGGGGRGDDRGHAGGVPGGDRPRSRCFGCDLPACSEPCSRE